VKELPEKIWQPPRAASTAVIRAKELRKDSTYAEDLLWMELRNRRFKSHKFRRQHPLGKYILDFFSYGANLAIELDGPIHDTQNEADTWRQQIIESRGIRVIRFRNEEVEHEMESVLTKIADALAEASTSSEKRNIRNETTT
jgi:very-short-patch-repair endonuclease